MRVIFSERRAREDASSSCSLRALTLTARRRVAVRGRREWVNSRDGSTRGFVLPCRLSRVIVPSIQLCLLPSDCTAAGWRSRLCSTSPSAALRRRDAHTAQSALLSATHTRSLFLPPDRGMRACAHTVVSCAVSVCGGGGVRRRADQVPRSPLLLISRCRRWCCCRAGRPRQPDGRPAQRAARADHQREHARREDTEERGEWDMYDTIVEVPPSFGVEMA